MALPDTSRRSFLLAGAATLLPSFTASPASAAEPIYTPPSGSLKGTTVLITGANTGLGLASAKRVAAAGANVIVTARSKAKADGAAMAVKDATTEAGSVMGVELDLADLESVRTFPERLKVVAGDNVAIDVLMNNAGVMAIPERLTTADGFEKTMGVNHLGHFALVAALLPALKRARDGFRIINVSSDAHRFVTPSSMSAALEADLDPAYSTWGSYGLSKAANVLFTVELQQRIERAGLRGSAVCLHPGAVQTDLTRYVIGGVAAEDTRKSEEATDLGPLGKVLKKVVDAVVLPVDQGANTQVYLAAAADSKGDRGARGGVYFDKMQPVLANEAATNPELARQLWKVSERLVGVKLEL